MPAVAQHLPDLEGLDNDKGIDLEILQCSGCGLVQLSNDPVPYYREVIRSSTFSEEMSRFRKKQFEDYIKKYSLDGRKIVEIGCGRGEYLSILQQLGLKAHGLEYGVESIKQCIENGLNVSKGFVETSKYKINGAPFEAFFLMNFLEHLPDPSSFLRGIHANLVENALGLVEVPNFDMILQEKLFSEFTRDHLLYFTRDTLRTTLSINGFDVIECYDVWHKYIISAVVRKRCRMDVNLFNEHQAKLKDDIHEFISRFNKVAIWGAGHQSFAIISLTNLAGKIRYIVDSATFKQGRYSPVSHIPIVSPVELDIDPVQAILVMAAGYSDEVARIIKLKYDGNISIGILRESGLERL